MDCDGDRCVIRPSEADKGDAGPVFVLHDILSESLVVKHGNDTGLASLDMLKGKYVGLYFSGHWYVPVSPEMCLQ